MGCAHLTGQSTAHRLVVALRLRLPSGYMYMQLTVVLSQSCLQASKTKSHLFKAAGIVFWEVLDK